MNNRPADLVAVLMDQANRLNDPKLKGEALRDEIARSKEMAALGNTVVGAHNLQIAAFKAATDAGLRADRMTPLLLGHTPASDDPANGK